MVALTLAALEPELIDRLQLAEVPDSFKDLLADKVTYAQAPSLFCMGLLRCADVSDLKLLAYPTKIEILEGGTARAGTPENQTAPATAPETRGRP
jgi:hypothetical protein